MNFDPIDQCPSIAQTTLDQHDAQFDRMFQPDFNLFEYKRRGSSLLRRANSTYNGGLGYRGRSPEPLSPLQKQEGVTGKLKQTSPFEEAQKDTQFQVYIANAVNDLLKAPCATDENFGMKFNCEQLIGNQLTMTKQQSETDIDKFLARDARDETKFSDMTLNTGYFGGQLSSPKVSQTNASGHAGSNS